ncbi:MAG: hypothetical protein J7604_23145 [Sporocytophaga sp.]|uniref:hypothetical protein n=1 Tax=Sporocytophaga sp. TaxID=2231183 RepID=UPI001B10382C|nr:hypothetical protein [Sporocytophaga sp.]MBO9703129.1 hypothetical protein [Sporocytophaga sp.]
MREHYKSESQYVKLTEDVNKKIKLLVELISSEFKNIVFFLKGYPAQEDRENQYEQNRLPTEIISSITTNLQYQDILSQRLDHIKVINDMIIQEFKESEYAKDNSTVLITHTNKITEVNTRQLEETYNEYISICAILRRDLDNFEKQSRPKNSNSLSSYVPFKNSLKIGALVSEIKQNLKAIASINFDYSDAARTLDVAAMKIQSVYTMQSERDVLYACIPDMQEKYRITFNNDNDIFF